MPTLSSDEGEKLIQEFLQAFSNSETSKIKEWLEIYKDYRVLKPNSRTRTYNLIEDGFLFTEIDNKTEPLLNLAVKRNDYQMVKTLLEAGINPNLAGEDDLAALHLSILCCEPKFTKLLLEAGADQHFINETFNEPPKKPIDLAKNTKHENIFLAHSLKESLDNTMSIMNKKKQVLEKLFSSKEQANNEDRMILDAFVTKTSHLLPFMLELKSHSKSRQKAKEDDGLDYQPVFLKGAQNMKAFEIYLAELIHKKQPFLFDCIYSGGKDNNTSTHCQPVQVYYDGKSQPIIYTLDATGGLPANNSALHDLKTAIGAKIKLN